MIRTRILGKPRPHWLVLAILTLFVAPIFLIVTAWTAGAIVFDGPAGKGGGNNTLAIAWLILTIALIFAIGGRKRRILVWLGCVAIVLVPWSTIKPSNDREWKQDWRKTGWADINGDRITFHNFRNFDYKSGGEIVENWETRTVHLSKLQRLDYFHDPFGGDLMAHPLLSFDFGENGHVVLSIETRREVGESFSKIGGLYKMFELQYIFGDERDLVRVRSNVRKEPVHLYRTTLDQENVVGRFLDSVKTLNDLKEKPRWYNVLTANCTTSLRAQTSAERRLEFDYRMLANGRLDEFFYEQNVIQSVGLAFPELRKRSFINGAAQAAHDDPEFSKRIREERPGF